jgi:hypothetical protein
LLLGHRVVSCWLLRGSVCCGGLGARPGVPATPPVMGAGAGIGELRPLECSGVVPCRTAGGRRARSGRNGCPRMIRSQARTGIRCGLVFEIVGELVEQAFERVEVFLGPVGEGCIEGCPATRERVVEHLAAGGCDGELGGPPIDRIDCPVNVTGGFERAGVPAHGGDVELDLFGEVGQPQRPGTVDDVEDVLKRWLDRGRWRPLDQADHSHQGDEECLGHVPRKVT